LLNNKSYLISFFFFKIAYQDKIQSIYKNLDREIEGATPDEKFKSKKFKKFR